MDLPENTSEAAPSRPVIKRMYGRRREPAADATLLESTVPTDASSRATSTDIPSPYPHDEYPPTSDGLDASTSSPASHSDAEASHEDEDDGKALSSRYEFDWRKKLRVLDEDDNLVQEVVKNASNQLVDGDDAHTSPQSLCAIGGSFDAKSTEQEGVKKSSNSSQQRDTMRHVSPVASRSPSPIVRRRTQRGKALALVQGSQSSDGESSDALNGSPLQAVLSRLSSPPSLPQSQNAKGKGKQRATEALRSDEERMDDDGDLGPSNRRRRSMANGKQKRVKPPTKKEKEETQKAMARIMAERDAALPAEQTKRYEITDLLAKLTKGHRDPVKQDVPAKVIVKVPDNSDPIQPFSSSPTSFIEDRARMPSRGRSASLKPSARTPSPALVPSFQPNGLLGFSAVHGVGDSSDEEMPDIGSVLHDDARSREGQEMRQRLAETKRRALAQQQNRATLSDGDDSDLEIVQDDMHAVAREEAQARRANAAHGVRRSVGKHAQLAMAGVRPRKSSATTIPSLAASAAAAPTFRRKGTHDGVDGQLTAQQLNQMLFAKARKQAALETQQKEEHWRKVGGKVKSRPADQAPGFQNAILEYAQRVANAQASAEADEEDEEEDADDPDYQPASEDQQPSGNEADSDVGNQQVPPSQAEVVEESENDENDENASPILRGRTGRPRRSLIAVHSDDEEDAPSDSLGRVLVADSSFVLPTPQHASQGTLRHRASTSSLEGPIEGGTDKENDATLAYGDDKENAIIASQPSAFNRASSFFSQSQGRPLLLSNGGPMESTPQDGRRAPFQELRTDEDDLSLSLSSDRRGPARRLTFTPDLPLHGEENAVQQIRSGSPSPIRPVVLKGGLADLFESQASEAPPSPIAPKAIQGGGLADFFSQESALDEPAGIVGAKISQDLALTEDLALQPALDIRQSLLRKADDIFEKEQQLIVEAALQAASPEKKSVFVNEHGFLTQTRPMKTPLRSQLFTPTQAAKISQRPMQDVFSPRSAVRQPLATIAALMTNNDDDDDVDAHPLMRLKRRKISPEKSVASGSRGGSASPTPHKPKNAFEMMRQASMHPQKLPALLGGKTKRSEFIEGEAEESDDDEIRGFGLRKRVEDEDEDDEAQDQTLQELVDDQDMDENTLAEDAVLEKHREQLEQDDQEVEKLHQDAIQGKLRMARRNRGVGFEDDDSDEEDDDAARARRRMQRQKRNVQGDSLDEIAKDPASAPFVKAYLEPLNDDDDDDFKQMEQNDDTLVDPQDMDVDEDEGQDEEITAAELRQQLAAAARESKHFEVMDPHDVSYVENDGDSEEDTPLVKEFSGPSKRAASRKDGDWDPAMQPKRDGDNEQDRVRMQRWAKGETRVFATGRNTGSVSVVGGAKKAGTATRGVTGRTAAHGPKQANKVTKTPSLLSTVSTSRRAKFQG